MKHTCAALVAAALLALSGLPAHAAPVDYQIDPEHTEIVVTWNRAAILAWTPLRWT